LPHFDKIGYDVTLVELRHPSRATEAFKDLGVEVTNLGRGKYNPITLIDLIKIIRRENADIIHCHGYGSSTFCRVAGLITRTPVVIHEHMIDQFTPRHMVLMDKALSPLTSKAIAVSGAVKIFMNTKRGIPLGKIDVIHNGLPTEYCNRYSEEEKVKIRFGLDVSDTYPVITVTGRLDHVKGHEVLIRALSILADSEMPYICLIVGDGELMPSLQKLAKDLGVSEHTRFLGFRTDISEILSITDIMVISSYSEGCSLALLEGMAAGTAIVSTAVGGIPEMVDDKETALLIKPGDPKAMSCALETLIKDKTFRRKLGAQAKKVCEENYLITQTISRFIELYQQLLMNR